MSRRSMSGRIVPSAIFSSKVASSSLVSS
jgi:hypothetical protein